MSTWRITRPLLLPTILSSSFSVAIQSLYPFWSPYIHGHRAIRLALSQGKVLHKLSKGNRNKSLKASIEMLLSEKIASLIFLHSCRTGIGNIAIPLSCSQLWHASSFLRLTQEKYAGRNKLTCFFISTCICARTWQSWVSTRSAMDKFMPFVERQKFHLSYGNCNNMNFS
jgi:hypothetical protein